MSAQPVPQPSHRTDEEQIDRTNAAGQTPVVFIPGLWLLPSAWDRWLPVFAAAGYAPVCPGWPGGPGLAAEAYAEPAVFASTTVGQVAGHFAAVIGKLDKKPVVIGHSFGGLLTQMLAGRGLVRTSVAIGSAPFRGVLPLPISEPRPAGPVLADPENRHRAVPLTFEQFTHAVASGLDEGEAKDLYETFAVPAAGAPALQAAASPDPWAEAKVNSTNPARGPMLIMSAENDHTVPAAISDANYAKQKRNTGVTEFTEMPDRGHSLTIDGGWGEVADTALAFVNRFA